MLCTGCGACVIALSRRKQCSVVGNLEEESDDGSWVY
jgi:hypothetical protein